MGECAKLVPERQMVPAQSSTTMPMMMACVMQMKLWDAEIPLRATTTVLQQTILDHALIKMECAILVPERQMVRAQSSTTMPMMMACVMQMKLKDAKIPLRVTTTVLQQILDHALMRVDASIVQEKLMMARAPLWT